MGPVARPHSISAFMRKALLAAAVLALSAVAGGTSAGADQIAYSCGYDICTINPDEPTEHTNVTQTAEENGGEESPAWSPDGKWIAYSGEYAGVHSGLFQLWVLDPSLPAPVIEAVNLSDSSEYQPDWEEPPVWSPDGSLVAFEGDFLNHETHVFVSPFDGTSDAVPIGPLNAGGQGTHPSWTPDAKVVFGRGSLYSANPNGTGITPFPGEGYDAVVSPDGKYVAVAVGSGPTTVRVYRTDGSGFVTMTKPGSGIVTDIAWSPDSTRIAYSFHETTEAGLWVAPVADPSQGHAQHAPTGWVDEFNADWSPDGTRIAFDAMPELGGYKQIFVAPAGGGESVQITHAAQLGMQPDWKPCASCAPPGNGSSGGGSGTGGGGGNAAGGGGAGTTKPGGAAKVPVKIKLAQIQKIEFVHNKLAVGINCNVEGGNPSLLPPELQKLCHVEAFAEYEVDNHTLHRVQLKSSSVVVAKGSATIPLGKTKSVELKLTGAGKKFAKPGKTLKLKLSVKLTFPGQAPQTLKQTIKAKVPKKK
jgi:Tol biopolymer transport system component